MILQIDATKIAHTLAVNDLCKYYGLTQEQIERLIDSDNSESLPYLYREKYDYYFENLTNHAL